MITNPLSEKTILLGVTGSIAAYKAADLASKLTQSGADVNTILTDAATKFISPITFQSVTGHPAYTDSDLWGAQAHVLHVGLAQKADAFLIAPATAQTMAKLAIGSADDLLSLTALALGTGQDAAPLILAPAMDAGMFSHTATQQNLHTLQERGVLVVGPEAGHLASGLIAKGRMTEPVDIISFLRHQLSREGALGGKRVIVTAGATQEALDPVRYLTNHASGKQGYALAQAADNAGAQVTLISGPTVLKAPSGVELISIRSALEMENATLQACQQADILIMAAAVADFRPAQTANQKIKKTGGIPTISLESNPDILANVKAQQAKSGFPKILVGFAAETQDLLANAQNKLEKKGLDMIAANDISASDAGFAVDSNRVTLLFRDGSTKELPLMSKQQVAAEIIQQIINLRNSGEKPCR